MKGTFRSYVILTVASLIMICGIYVFKFPNNYSFGGVAALAIVLGAVLPLSVGTINFILNVFLLIVGFIFFGRSFGVKTLYVSLLTSTGTSILEKLLPMNGPLTNEPLLELIFAILLPAVGTALMFYEGASSGGMDIVAMIMKKRKKMSNIGTPLFIIDFVVVVAACFVFGIKTGLYSMIGLLAKSLIVDGVIENLNQCKYFTIISNNPKPICDYVHEELNSSATLFEGEGTYEHKKRYIILTVMKPRQAFDLQDYIRTNQSDAFIMITKSSEIIGKGFKQIV